MSATISGLPPAEYCRHLANFTPAIPDAQALEFAKILLGNPGP